MADIKEVIHVTVFHGERESFSCAKLATILIRYEMKNFCFLGAMALMLSSCFTHTYMVGDGSQTGVEVKEKNYFVMYGLVPISTSNPHMMAGGAENYEVTTSHTFIDGILNSLTFGIYNPTTTVVRK